MHRGLVSAALGRSRAGRPAPQGSRAARGARESDSTSVGDRTFRGCWPPGCAGGRSTQAPRLTTPMSSIALLGQVESLDIVTLEPEGRSRFRNGGSRTSTPICASCLTATAGSGPSPRSRRWNTWEWTTASTGSRQARSSDPNREVALALAELRRVLAPGGTVVLSPFLRGRQGPRLVPPIRSRRPRRARGGGPRHPARMQPSTPTHGWLAGQRSRTAPPSARLTGTTLADPSPVADLAAAARAVACLRFDY